jgi:hypothetical protein
LADYGLLANRYVERFEQKWVRGDTTDTDELLGTGDIQSLADLGNRCKTNCRRLCGHRLAVLRGSAQRSGVTLHELAQKGLAAAIRVHVSGVGEIKLLSSSDI